MFKNKERWCGMYKLCNKCGRRYPSNSKCCNTYQKKEDIEKKKVYNSTRWRKLRLDKLREYPYCIRCFDKWGYLQTDNLELHHILSLGHYPQYKFDTGNLAIICRTCNLELGDSNKIDFSLPTENLNFLKQIKYLEA